MIGIVGKKSKDMENALIYWRVLFFALKVRGKRNALLFENSVMCQHKCLFDRYRQNATRTLRYNVVKGERFM